MEMSEKARKEADRVVDKIMDMIDNDGRLSLDAIPIIADALTQASREGILEGQKNQIKLCEKHSAEKYQEGYQKGVEDTKTGTINNEIIKRSRAYDSGYNKAIEDAVKVALEHENKGQDCGSHSNHDYTRSSCWYEIANEIKKLVKT